MLFSLLLVVPILVIWGSYSKLAYRNSRNGLLYTFVGIVTYVAASIGFDFVRYPFQRLVDTYFYTEYWMWDIIESIARMGLAAFCTWVLYYVLRHSWEKNPPKEEDRALLDDPAESE